MQKWALYSPYIQVGLITDDLEFGSTCFIILVLPLTPLWPWKFVVFLYPLPHLYNGSDIFTSGGWQGLDIVEYVN